jgi:hypothetical protein
VCNRAEAQRQAQQHCTAEDEKGAHRELLLPGFAWDASQRWTAYLDLIVRIYCNQSLRFRYSSVFGTQKND